MIEKSFFPTIRVQKTASRFRATAILSLASLLNGKLMGEKKELDSESSEYRGALDPKRLQGVRTAFVTALSSWPDHITLEMRLASVPDLMSRVRGRLSLVMVIHARSASKDQAKEELIRTYLSLMPLLAAHFPEAEFLPVVPEMPFVMAALPEKPRYALAISRQFEDISLSNPLHKRAIGLLAVDQEKHGESIIHCYPWVPSLDDWSRLLDMLMAQLDPVQLIIRLKHTTLAEAQRERLEGALRKCEEFIGAGIPYQLALKRQVEMIRDVTLTQFSSLSDSSYHIGVFLVSPQRLDPALANITGQAITALRPAMASGNIYHGGFSVGEVRVTDALDASYYYETDTYSAVEAASAFRIPSPPIEDRPGLPIRRNRTSYAMLPPRPINDHDQISLFINKHKQMDQTIRIGSDDRMRHTFIIGQTGTGKSTLMEHMILQDIQNGRGLAVIDPHGEMIDAILGKIPQTRLDDVILFDFLDRQRPLGFNILEWSTIDERDLIIDEIYTTIDHLYDMRRTGGPIFENNLRGMLKMLMGDKRQTDFIPTLLDFRICYLYEDFRSWLKKRTNEIDAIDFLNEAEVTKGDASLQALSPYITSKFSRFTSDKTLRRIIGQEKTTFNFDEIMNEGKILLVKLGKGRFGSQVSALLANQLVSRFKHAAMKRGAMAPHKRRDFFLYVDECHNLPPENFTELLSEARKYRLGLIMATQYTAQMSGNNVRNHFLEAVIGNVGTIVIFRVGQEDARLMAPILHPYFNAHDIVGLPNWQGYARLQVGGASVPPFSFLTVKDDQTYEIDVSDKIINLARNRYGVDAAMVDAQIEKRRHYWCKNK